MSASPAHFPPRPATAPHPEPLPALPVPPGPLLDDLRPSLARAWHPVALSRELRLGGWLQVRLLGGIWSLHRGEEGLAAAPPAFDVGEPSSARRSASPAVSRTPPPGRRRPRCSCSDPRTPTRPAPTASSCCRQVPGGRCPHRRPWRKGVAVEQRLLGQAAALQAALRSPGLPLQPRAGLHLAADRPGVALRRAASRFTR